jgi:anthranilate phosphoribosyltransferase
MQPTMIHSTSYSAYIKRIGRGAHATDLEEYEAYQMFSAMLDDGVADLELGAIILAMRMKSESASEIMGFYRAMSERIYTLDLPDAPCLPVVLPCYNGARRQANLLPLLALLLRNYGIPVLLHGVLQGNARVTTASILRELGIAPSVNLAHAKKQLKEQCIAFLPTVVLSPGLASILALRDRLGVRNSGHSLVKLLDPFSSGCLRVVNVTHPEYLSKMNEFLIATGARALLLRGTEGEPYANPKRRPQMNFFNAGKQITLFEAEEGTLNQPPPLPADMDALTTANWISRVLAHEISVPQPIINQLACCLYGSGYADDMSQAIALAAGKTMRFSIA